MMLALGSCGLGHPHRWEVQRDAQHAPPSSSTTLAAWAPTLAALSLNTGRYCYRIDNMEPKRCCRPAPLADEPDMILDTTPHRPSPPAAHPCLLDAG